MVKIKGQPIMPISIPEDAKEFPPKIFAWFTIGGWRFRANEVPQSDDEIAYVPESTLRDAVAKAVAEHYRHSAAIVRKNRKTLSKDAVIDPEFYELLAKEFEDEAAREGKS